MIGTSVGNYRVVEKLGDGGMGTVYRALDQMLDREVALKVMKPELSRQAALSERFRQEAIALARLNHPNIAAVYGLERSGDDLVMVMEFIRGETLESIVQRSGRLSWTRAFELCAAVLEALDHAHDKGVVHRDIKPANIMLARDGTVKVMDFGIARIMGRSRQTRVGAAVGTPMYMSPEQLKGEEVDGRSDLYSLGAVCYELITGRLAFEADSDYELMMKQLNEPPPPVRASLPEVPEVVDGILQHAMAKGREARYRNASVMRDEMRRATPAPATGQVRRPAPETRLADTSPPPRSATPPDREVQLPRAGVTADQPVVSRGAFVETRLADSGPSRGRSSLPPGPTRLGSAHATADLPAPRRLADWRIWSGLAALALVGALTARTLRQDPLDREALGPALDTAAAAAAADTTAPAPPVSLGDSTGGARPAAPIAAPPPVAAAGTGVALPVEDAPPRSPPTGPAPTVRKRPAEGSGKTAAPPVSPPVDERVRPAPPPAPVTERAEPRPSALEPGTSENSEAATSAIAQAIHEFGRAVSDGQSGRVGGVLRADGDLTRQWMDLMNEGRLAMDVSGTPDVDLSGAHATARFTATLNVRSAFGANKRRTAQFVAELSRTAGRWHVTSVRPAGGLSLK